MRQRLAFDIKSAICAAWFRMHGMRPPQVSCEGRLPGLYGRGNVRIGTRFAVRGRILRCELGAAVSSAQLIIGDRVSIGQGASVVAYRHIEIGNDTLIDEFVTVYDTNHHSIDAGHPTKFAPVIVGSDVWLGRDVVVLPGSKIGNYTVVAAGSIVNGDLPPRVLAAGNPAQPVRELNIPDGWRRQLSGR